MLHRMCRTLSNFGYPYKGNAIQYMLAPKGLPPDIRKKLIDAFLAATKTPLYIDMAKKNELYDPTEMTGAALDKYLLDDRAEIGALIQRLGLAKK
jgi:tripartite-type tricarboxylate transporter receptor subunit TctC